MNYDKPTFKEWKTKPDYSILVIRDGEKKKFFGIKKPSWLKRLWWKLIRKKNFNTIEIHGRFW